MWSLVTVTSDLRWARWRARFSAWLVSWRRCLPSLPPCLHRPHHACASHICRTSRAGTVSQRARTRAAALEPPTGCDREDRRDTYNNVMSVSNSMTSHAITAELHDKPLNETKNSLSGQVEAVFISAAREWRCVSVNDVGNLKQNTLSYTFKNRWIWVFLYWRHIYLLAWELTENSCEILWVIFHQRVNVWFDWGRNATGNRRHHLLKIN